MKQLIFLSHFRAVSLRCLSVAPFILAMLACRAEAQLSWSTRQLDFHPTMQDTEVNGDFEFVNSSATPVTISDVKTSCGCTTAALDKKSYAPGEKGKISVAFHFGDRIGLQQKQIMVTTDSPEEPSVQLTLRTYIPELIKMEPRVVAWPLHSDSQPRIIKITTGTDQPIRILGVRASDERIFAQLKPVESGRSYELTVLVNSTDEPIRGIVRIETDYPTEHPKTYNLQVEVSQPFVHGAAHGTQPTAGAPIATASAPTATASAPTANGPAASVQAAGQARHPSGGVAAVSASVHAEANPGSSADAPHESATASAGLQATHAAVGVKTIVPPTPPPSRSTAIASTANAFSAGNIFFSDKATTRAPQIRAPAAQPDVPSAGAPVSPVAPAQGQ